MNKPMTQKDIDEAIEEIDEIVSKKLREEDEYKSLIVASPIEYICKKHGNISNQTLNSTMSGHEATLCLRCVIEKLKEIGVCEAKLKERNT